jgi:hypothetical protein
MILVFKIIEDPVVNKLIKEKISTNKRLLKGLKTFINEGYVKINKTRGQPQLKINSVITYNHQILSSRGYYTTKDRIRTVAKHNRYSPECKTLKTGQSNITWY